jgi:hypothetical protein
MVLDAVPPKPNAVPSKVKRVILFPSVEAAVPAATMLTSQSTRLPLQILRLETRLPRRMGLCIPSTNRNSRAFAREFPNLTN